MGCPAKLVLPAHKVCSLHMLARNRSILNIMEIKLILDFNLKSGERGPQGLHGKPGILLIAVGRNGLNQFFLFKFSN